MEEESWIRNSTDLVCTKIINNIYIQIITTYIEKYVHGMYN